MPEQDQGRSTRGDQTAAPARSPPVEKEQIQQDSKDCDGRAMCKRVDQGPGGMRVVGHGGTGRIFRARQYTSRTLKSASLIGKLMIIFHYFLLNFPK